MLRRASSTIRSRLLQAYQIASWRGRKLSKREVEDCAAIRHICARLFTVTEAAIEDMPPQEVGVLYSVLHKCIITLAVLMVQSPTNTETDAFVMELKHYARSRCPNFEICTVALIELATFTLRAMSLEYEAVPEYAAALADLHNQNCIYEQMCKAFDMNRRITKRVNLALFHGSLPKLREECSFKEMIAFARGYRREDCDSSYVFSLPPSLPVEYNVNEVEGDHEGVGERIELAAFCQPAESIMTNIECPVCAVELSDTEQDRDQRAVVTKCGHTFHKLCLDKWVNDSGMKASNTCPSCRTVLCKPRECLHASVDAFSVAGPNERPAPQPPVALAS